jgi:hypothetical protein
MKKDEGVGSMEYMKNYCCQYHNQCLKKIRHQVQAKINASFYQ